jgi:hypothetical protein
MMYIQRLNEVVNASVREGHQRPEFFWGVQEDVPVKLIHDHQRGLDNPEDRRFIRVTRAVNCADVRSSIKFLYLGRFEQ